MSIRIEVRLFARARELYGNSETSLEMAEGSRISDCFDALVLECPGMVGMRDRLLTARNESYGHWADAVEDGDVVAFIPPVSGG